MRLLILYSLFSGIVFQAGASERRIHVFVALCDNATQGIIKVNPKIGDGDIPSANLYWGCSDGMRLYFKNSSKWELEKTENAVSDTVLERLTFRHTAFEDVILIAEAYRGSEMKQCLNDFLAAVASRETSQTKLIAFIGHNGLMDHPGVTAPEGKGNKDVIVLSCLSDRWFAERLDRMAANRILMTRSLMYPGSFILHDALEGWLRGESKASIRDRAAKSYARNQKISVKGARSVFSDLK